MPTPAELFLSLFFGLVGSALSLYGKRCAHIPHVLIGLVLAAYPWFVSGALMILLVGAGLCVAAYFLRE